MDIETWLTFGYCHFLLEKERDNNDPNFFRCLQLSRKEVFLLQVFIHYAETMAIEEELAMVMAEQANSFTIVSFTTMMVLVSLSLCEGLM